MFWQLFWLFCIAVAFAGCLNLAIGNAKKKKRALRNVYSLAALALAIAIAERLLILYAYFRAHSRRA